MGFCLFTMAIGAVTGRQSLTIGVAAGATGTLFFVNGLAPLVDEIAWMQKLLQDPNPLANGFDLGAVAIFVLAIAVLLGVAIWASTVETSEPELPSHWLQAGV